MRRERDTEQKLKDFLESLKGIFTTKLVAGSIRGLSDRMFIWRGLVGFIEVKKENLEPTPEQMRRLVQVEQAGGFARSANAETLQVLKNEILNLEECGECGRLKPGKPIGWREVMIQIIQSRS